MQIATDRPQAPTAIRTDLGAIFVSLELSLTGNRFQILSRDGKPLYAGIVRVNPNAKPWAIDFEHTEEALKGKTWKGIYVLDGDTLTICDNAPNLDEGRPVSFETKSGSGYESSRSSARPLIEREIPGSPSRVGQLQWSGG